MGDAHTDAPEAHGESTSLDNGDGSRLYKPLLQPVLLVYASLKLALGFTHAGLLSLHALCHFSATACFQCFWKMLCLA